jgi:hypothetical protein
VSESGPLRKSGEQKSKNLKSRRAARTPGACSPRSESNPFTVQRKTTPSDFSSFEWRLEAQTAGATDTLPGTRSGKRSQTLFYNESQSHRGRCCFGKTPLRTVLEARAIAREKQIGDPFVTQMQA